VFIFTQNLKNLSMKKLLQFLLVLSLPALSFHGAMAQRYLSPIFPSASVTPDVVYANNIQVLTGTPTAVDLKTDIYQPAGAVDPLSQRPLVIILHTGSFLPPVINGSPNGARRDSNIVFTCTELAKRGYVAAAVSYRLGWNPAATGAAGQDIRTGTLLQAVYRAMQDAKSSVRFFKANASTYGIDTTKIIMGGYGSGGYVALACASVDKTQEINLPKFLAQTTNVNYGFVAGQSYVNQALIGDFDGFGGIPQLNNPNNNPGYSSDVDFVFNMGGALGDSSWLEAGDCPIVGFHVVSDPFAPYGNGAVIVPTTGDFVVDVSGSSIVAQKCELLGNNNCMINANFNDALSTYAASVNGGIEGLYPFYTATNPQSGPWDWYDSTTTVAVAQFLGYPASQGTLVYQNALLTNPDMSKAKATAYIDTIMGYVNPRIVTCLGLTTSINYLENLSSNVRVSPNPAQSTTTIFADMLAGDIRNVKVYDILGNLVLNVEGVNNRQFTIERNKLDAGVYIVRTTFDKGEATGKLIFN
jgi:hypothetical protein